MAGIILVLSVFWGGVAGAAAPVPVDCAAVSKIIQYARDHHVRREQNATNLPELGAKAARRFTNQIIENYSSFFTKDEVVTLQLAASGAPGKLIVDGLLAGDCSFFEKQTAVLERAFRRFKNKFYLRFNDMVETLLAAPVLRIEDLQARPAYAANVDEIRSRRIEELAFAIEYDESVVSGEFTRKQAAQNVLYQMYHSFNAFSAGFSRFAYEGAAQSFVAVLDPHSQYIVPSKAKEFITEREIHIGVGLVLSTAPFGVRVVKVIPGGPAALSGKIKERDIIFAVNGRSIIGVTVATVVSWIKGSKGSSVRLQIGRVKNGGMIGVREINVRRDLIQEAQMNLSQERRTVAGQSILIVQFTEFYTGVAEDLRLVLLSEQKKLPIDAVVLDLRDNRGGWVNEAVMMSSLFMERGPVVHTAGIDEESLYSVFPKRTYYRGPLIVAVNSGSASASEILAGTLQDYRRAIIVGHPHTNGKGNFQSVYTPEGTNGKVPTGLVVLTAGLYFTAGGRSPQFDGVQSDIVIPGPSYDESYLERAEEGALQPNSLDGILYSYRDLRANRDNFLKKALPTLKTASEKRVGLNAKFAPSAVITAADQLDEIVNIAVEYAQQVVPSCVMTNCSTPQLDKN